MRRVRGFTLVEIMVVIVVIVILLTVATLGLNKYQQNGRDAQRTVSATSIADSLEKYYDANGEYPSCTQMTDSATTLSGSSGALAGIDPTVLVTPKATSGTTNSLQCADLTSTTSGDYFSYLGDGSDSCSTVSCLQFTIKYLDEADGTVKTISSKHTVDINTSGAVTVTAGAVSYISTAINWNQLQNATGYTVQRDTANTFSTGNLKQVSLAATASSYQFNDVAPGTTYYYRVQAATGVGSVSLWSNILNKATTALPIPNLTNTQTNPVTVTESWGSTSGITNYTLQRAANSSFTSAQSDTVAGTSKTYNDTPIGAARYYRVRSTITNTSGTTFTGTWSSVLTYTSFVPQPGSAPSVASAISGATATGTSGTVSCTQGGTPQYSLRETHKANSGYGDSWTGWTAWSSTRTYSVTAYEGYQHTFQAKAACVYSGSYSSEVTSGTASSVRGINTPAAPTWPSGLSHSWQQRTYGHYMWYGTYCPAGTWVNDTWFHSQSWPGSYPVDYYHTFGFDDYWELGPSGGANVWYEASYTCVSSYTGSDWAPHSSDNVWVYW